MPEHEQLIGGRYRLGEVLGCGGMGTVWSAHDELLGRPVAVKEVLPPPHHSEAELADLRQRTLVEARAAARIASPAAVAVYDVVEEDGHHPWLVMELLAPRNLEDVLAERCLSPQEAAVLGLTLLSALHAAELAGVLHRDVKPANVMFRGTDDDMSRAVLTDFGIARFVEDTSMTATGTLLGSPAYVAPERARGRPATLASDLWSLGVTLWKAVEGHSPFHRESPLATLTAIVMDDLPPATGAGPLAPVLEGLLRKDPLERTPVLQLRDQLHAVAHGESWPPPDPVAPLPSVSSVPSVAAPASPDPAPVLTGSPVSPVSPVRPRRRVGSLVAALLTMLVVGAVAVVVATFWDARQPEPEAQARSTATGTGAQAAPPATSAGSTVTESAPVVPAGHRLHTDSTGFELAVPQGWTETRDGTAVRFSDPGSSASLLVDQTDDPKDDPLADWQTQERSVSQRLDDYQLVGDITAHQARGWEGADWEFTYSSGGEVRHALNRNIVTTPGQLAYALLWTVPEEQWEERRDDFDAIFASFQPRLPA